MSRPGHNPALRGLAVLFVVAGCAATREAVERARSGDAYAVLPSAAVGLMTGRDRPDGPDVLWIADEGGVHRIQAAAAPELVWKAPRFTTIQHAEAADLDGDGSTEWIVVLDAGRIRSEVIGWDGATRTRIGNPYFGFARPAPGHAEAGTVLLQKAGGDRPFWGPVHLGRFDGGIAEVREVLDLHDGSALFDLFWTPSAEGGRLFAGEANGQLSERRRDRPRDVVWRSEDRPWGRPVVHAREYRDLLGETRAEGVGFATAPVLADLDGDGAAELWIAGHPLPPVRVFESITGLPGGDVRRLDAAARGLVERVRSPLVGRAIVGIAPWRHGERPVIAAAVWTRLAGGFERPETRVLLFDPATGDPIEVLAEGGSSGGP